MIIKDENSYAQIWNHAIRQDRRVKLLVTTLKSLLIPNLNYQVLELGAGQGLLSQALYQEGFSVTATEKSPLLYQHYLKRRSESHLKYYCQEALAFLQQNSNTHYPAILGIGILHHIWHEPTWGKRLYQASNNNGVLIFLEPNPHNPIARCIFKTPWLRHAFKLDPQEQLKNVPDISRELVAAGWTNIQITYVDLFYPFFPPQLRKLVEYAEHWLPSFLNKYLAQSILIIATRSE